MTVGGANLNNVSKGGNAMGDAIAILDLEAQFTLPGTLAAHLQGVGSDIVRGVKLTLAGPTVIRNVMAHSSRLRWPRH